MSTPELEERVSALRSIWAEVLSVESDEIEDDDNFFDIGGDSMLALEAAAQARRAGLSMPTSGVLRRPVLRDLAEGVLDPTLFGLTAKQP